MNMVVMSVLSYLKEVDTAEVTHLKSEENTNKIAEAQGIIAGNSLLRDTIKNRFLGYNSNLPDLPNYPTWANMPLYSLDAYCDSLKEVLHSQEYEEMQESIRKSFETKKEWLFNEAEKGRDLVFIKGWKKAMESFDKVIDDIQENRDKRKAELPFESGSPVVPFNTFNKDPSPVEDEEYEEYDPDGIPPEVDGEPSAGIF